MTIKTSDELVGKSNRCFSSDIGHRALCSQSLGVE